MVHTRDRLGIRASTGIGETVRTNVSIYIHTPRNASGIFRTIRHGDVGMNVDGGNGDLADGIPMPFIGDSSGLQGLIVHTNMSSAV